ncbi:four helix bundle protein [Flavobacterium sp. N1718]|uniref:four helix bundle protein n=1 Tax=unclassified Flavobacterium TaxID=196869 RepID=UPI0029CAC572|nr:four helix bundle protein [Flavobacterium sp. N1718]
MAFYKVSAICIKKMEEPTISKRTFDFSLRIIQLADNLEQRRRFVLANQLLRSGTSIGANVREASAAESRKDFIHKMAIASKEARETLYWLQLIQFAESNLPELEDRVSEIKSIVNILTKIVKTTKVGVERATLSSESENGPTNRRQTS